MKFVLIVSVIGDINFIYNHIQKLSLSDCFKQFLLKMMPNCNCLKSFALVGEPMLILPAMQIAQVRKNDIMAKLYNIYWLIFVTRDKKFPKS